MILSGPLTVLTAAALSAALSGLARAADETAHSWAGSQTIPMHRVVLRDENGEPVLPAVTNSQPFSARASCGACHEYGVVRHGRHFNSMESSAARGRAQQPWILADTQTGTQLPLSYRGFAGTWQPSVVGLSPWNFTREFGRHFPGGGVGETGLSVEPKGNWSASGSLEINCLLCHAASEFVDNAEWVRQIVRGNFRLAGTAASGLGDIESPTGCKPGVGAVSPDTNRIDAAESALLFVRYRQHMFDSKGRALMEIAVKPKDSRCLFCHARAETGQAKCTADGDVHSRKGVACVGCHRNGLDHKIIRGYETEADWQGDPLRKASTCQGCHMGSDRPDSALAAGGRFGAPVPQHRGLPPLHFEKLACTACHSGPWPAGRIAPVSGPWPDGRLAVVRNVPSPAKPGPYGKAAWAATSPRILQGVLMKAEDGKIAPHRVVWPAFWAKIETNNLTPVKPEDVMKVAAGILDASTSVTNGLARIEVPTPEQPGGLLAVRVATELEGTPYSITEEQVAATLKALSENAGGISVKYAYIGSGRMFSINTAGELVAGDHPAAKPYAWPMAHDVRPAAQSLGVRSCRECHSFDSPFFHAKVQAVGPLKTQRVAEELMYVLEAQDGVFHRLLGLSFVLRPWFKIIGFSAALLTALALLASGLPALGRLMRHLAGRK